MGGATLPLVAIQLLHHRLEAVLGINFADNLIDDVEVAQGRVPLELAMCLRHFQIGHPVNKTQRALAFELPYLSNAFGIAHLFEADDHLTASQLVHGVAVGALGRDESARHVGERLQHFFVDLGIIL